MHREFIQKLTNLVEANLANENFGPEELAREVGMSHSTFNRKLKSVLNQSASQFIREARLKKAKELLRNEDATVAEIAYSVGFGSATYFSKCFHEFFGVAPGESRNHEQVYETDEQLIDQPVEPNQKKRKRTKIRIVLVFSLIVIITLSVFLINEISRTTINEKSIAVLPFISLSGEIDNQYLTVGMMDAILSNLSKIKDLRVISRTSVEQYRDSKKPAKTIGKELDVGYLLEGSLQMYDNKVRLIVQLIRTKNEDHVWSNSYDYDRIDIFSVQSEVAENVADELQVAITPEEKQLIRKIPTTNLTAYDYYQRGKDELDNNGDSVSLEKAQRLFQKALKLDSTFALAYTGLARVYESKLYWKTYLTENFMDSVFIMANKALDYDNHCSEAYYYRGSRYYQIAKIPEAVKELNKAIKFNPNDWNAYYLLSSVLGVGYNDYVGVISNRHETVLRNRGTRLPGLLSGLGKIYMDLGFPELGKQYCQQAFELGGDTSRYSYCMRLMEQYAGNYENAYQLAKNVYKTDSTIGDELLIYCSLTGRSEEAYILGIKNIERYKKAGGIDLWSSKSIGYYLWQKDRTKEAEFYFNKQIKFDEESIKLGRWNSIQKGAHFDLAGVYAVLGDKERAYQYLDEVNKKQFFPLWWVILFRHDPLFNNIRQEPRFQNILKDVEAKYQAEHERAGKWLKEQGLL